MSFYASRFELKCVGRRFCIEFKGELPWAGLSMESFQTEGGAAFVLRLGGTRPPRGWTRYPQHREGRRMGCGPGRRGDQLQQRFWVDNGDKKGPPHSPCRKGLIAPQGFLNACLKHTPADWECSEEGGQLRKKRAWPCTAGL